MDMSPHFFLAARNRLPFSMTMTMTMTIDHRPSTIARSAEGKAIKRGPHWRPSVSSDRRINLP